MISSTIHSLWWVGKYVTVDETIIQYEPKNDLSHIPKKKRKRNLFENPASNDRAPICTIKGKPHDTGLLFYGLAVKTKIHSLPIFLGINFITNPTERSAMKSMYTLL